ncbi:MAG: LuxR C-terminal-related transcriptional regulator, partial [Azoarcus sp.]|nr:LuxR C-terminal-related transcriptional regulator [Azoarcus sp.]
KAKDFERALTVLESDMSRHPITERANFYFTMFQDCPEDILERHMGASFKYAIAAFSAGDFSAFGARMAWLAKRCAAMPPGKEADHWRGELHVLQALAEFNDIEAMSRHHKMALALLKAPTSLYGADSAWALGSPSVLFMFYRESGKLKDAQRLMHECMPTYYQLTSYHGAGAEYLMETEALYNAGEFAKAGEACQTALAKAARHNQIGNMFCAMFLQIRLALLAGDATALFGREAQLGLLADMRGLIARNRDFFLLHTADLCEGWLYATLGLYKKIPPWLRSELSEESRLYAFAKGCYYIVHGRAQLLAGEYFKLIGQFSGMLLAGAFSKNLLFFVYAHIYLAAAHEKTGQSQKAATTLNIALSVALPDALYMPFVENYDLIGPLLTKNLSGKNDQQALSRIEALAQQMKAGSESVLKKIQALRQLWGLTPREFEAALLIGKGLSYQQIADKMCVSVNTLKTHLQSITRKSGVSRRKGLYEIFRKD